MCSARAYVEQTSMAGVFSSARPYFLGHSLSMTLEHVAKDRPAGQQTPRPMCFHHSSAGVTGSLGHARRVLPVLGMLHA